MKKFWNLLLNLGVASELQKEEIKKVRLLNSILITGEGVLILLLIKGLLQGIQEEIAAPIMGMIIFAIPLTFNAFKAHSLARVLCILAPLVFLGGLTIFWGTERGSQMIIFAASGLAVLFFDKSRDLVVLSVLAGLVFLAVTIYNFSHDPFYVTPNVNSAYLINIVITFTLIFAISFRFKKENYAHLREIENKGLQIQSQNRQLRSLNDSLQSSISYAKTLQMAILPSKEVIHNNLKEHFIFLKPRDVVSGDFYYASEIDGKFFLAAVDCTGHGVPGAFMSMIGYSLLVEAIEVRRILDPAEILNYLQNRVRQALHQDESKNMDGMDLSIIAIDSHLNEMHFGAARNPLIMIDGNKEVSIYDGTRMSIGGNTAPTDGRKFTSQKIPIIPGTKFYIFSDGFQDQFGGPRDKKFSKRRFHSLLEELSTHPIAEQGTILEEKFERWKGPFSQTDDVLIIGGELA